MIPPIHFLHDIILRLTLTLACDTVIALPPELPVESEIGVGVMGDTFAVVAGAYATYAPMSVTFRGSRGTSSPWWGFGGIPQFLLFFPRAAAGGTKRVGMSVLPGLR